MNDLFKNAMTHLDPSQETMDRIYFNLQTEKKSIWRRNRSRLRVAIACLMLFLIIGTTGYAATAHFSILSIFRGDDATTQENAKRLIDSDVEQDQAGDTVVAKWVNTTVREAIHDGNEMIVTFEVKPTDPEKYFVGPFNNIWITPAGESVGMAFNDYAERIKKTGLPVYIRIETSDKEDLRDLKRDQIKYQYEDDQTLLIIYRLWWDDSTRPFPDTFNYVVEIQDPTVTAGTCIQKQSPLSFNVTNNTEMPKSIKYVPKDKKVISKEKGIAIDRVVFSNSDLSMTAEVYVRYTGKTVTKDEWFEKHASIWCAFFDKDKKEFGLHDLDERVAWSQEYEKPVKGDFGEKGSVYLYKYYFSSRELPDEIQIRYRDEPDYPEFGKEYGSLWLKKVK